MVKTTERKSRYANLKDYCHFAGEDDFIEVTEWSNGEGYDITISRKGGDKERFSLTWGEWTLLQVLMNWR